MIKEIIASTMLATSIGIQNTITTQETNKQVSMTEKSEWIYNETYTDDNNWSYTAYRNTKAKRNVDTQAFTIRTRFIEYYNNHARTTPTTNISNSQALYFLMNIQKTTYVENIKLLEFSQIGTILNTYVTNPTLFEMYNMWDEAIENNTTLNNFLNGNEITTIAEYQTIENEIANLRNTYYEMDTPSINSQNIANTLQNLNFAINGEYEEMTIMMRLIVRSSNTEDNLPKNQPYAPFGNYLTYINYGIKWEVNVNPGGTGEIIDLPGLLLMVLGMPFTFIAQSFDLTIFPGTYYEVNLAHIALAVIGAGILIFVVKKFLK